eukprot:TRINITY_DN191_c0_g2_i1.p2 TRINITY_DN191_c0_g2~~TRINITY_DN191_c0_g2_i1.p2  ORF type:complete len:340 (+),score=124.50 TRINITY_DN191_c0_g2_i1:75-1094(+)
MAGEGKYTLFGTINSPYSVKVRSYLRYKGVPHDWVLHVGERAPEFKKHAKLPLVPLLATPDGKAGTQDSTPIIETFEKANPEPSIIPDSAAMRFLSELLEEFADEWGNKWMFHYRWARPADQVAASERMAREFSPNKAAAEQFAKTLRKRMVTRGFTIGSNPRTAPLIEQDFVEAIKVLDRHLERRACLFGGRPALADFGLSGQLWNTLCDPTGGGLIRKHAPHVAQWCERMQSPTAHGAWEPWETLAPTLQPLLLHVRRFLTWSAANAAAIQSKAQELTVNLPGLGVWWQTVGGPQKYHAKSLRVIQQKYAAVRGDPQLREILSAAGCLAPLEGRAKL